MSISCSKCGNVDKFLWKKKWENVGNCGKMVLLLNHKAAVEQQSLHFLINFRG